MLSTHGLERRSRRLIMDSYTYGEFNMHIKTLIFAQMVVDWGFSHHPRQLIEPLLDIVIGNETVNFDNFIRSHFARDFEMIVLKKRENESDMDCLIPQGPLFLRHFNMLSWNDFVSLRGSRAINSDGTLNHWRDNPRAHWERGGWLDASNFLLHCLSFVVILTTHQHQ